MTATVAPQSALPQPDIFAKYPVFRGPYLLHRQPVGGVLVGEFWESGQFDVDLGTADFLVRCDGATTLGDVSAGLARDHGIPPPRARAIAAACVASATKQRILELWDAPGPRRVRVSGGTDGFYPIEIQMEITKRCNWYCTHCYAEAGGENQEELDWDTQLKPLLESLVGRVDRLLLTGGEPMYHRRWRDVVRFVGENFAQFHINTNGTLVTESMAKELSKWKDKMSLQVSLHGHVAPMHEAVTQSRGSFESTTRGITRLAQQGIAVAAATSVMPENADHMLDIVALADKLGCKAFKTGLVVMRGRAEEVRKFVLPLKKRKEFFAALDEAARRYPHMRIEMEESYGTSHDPQCGLIWRKCAMLHDGSITVCPQSPGEFRLGNLLRDGPVKVFNAPEMHVLHGLGREHSKICGSCAQYEFCGGCYVQGLLFAATGRCELAKRLDEVRRVPTREWLVRDQAAKHGEALQGASIGGFPLFRSRAPAAPACLTPRDGGPAA